MTAETTGGSFRLIGLFPTLFLAREMGRLGLTGPGRAGGVLAAILRPRWAPHSVATRTGRSNDAGTPHTSLSRYSYTALTGLGQ